MTPEDQDRMTELCKAMQQEEDSKKLTQLADELNALLSPPTKKAPEGASDKISPS